MSEVPGEDGEQKQSFLRRFWWVLAAAAVIIPLVIVSAKGQTPGEASLPKLTLESLNATVASLNYSTQYQFALQAEDMADIRSDLSSLPNWQPDIDSLKSRMTVVENASASQAANITSIGSNITSILNTLDVFGLYLDDAEGEIDEVSGNVTDILDELDDLWDYMYALNTTIQNLIIANNLTL